MRAALSLCFLLVVTAAQAQSGTVTPVPLPQLAPIPSTSLACIVNCDTAAMNCLNSCTPASASVSTPGSLPNTIGCTNGCTSIQLVCKQGCTR